MSLPSPDLSAMILRIDSLREEALSALAGATSITTLESWRTRFLGLNGQLKALMGALKDASRQEKPVLGQRLNELKVHLEAALEQHRCTLSLSAAGPRLDVTEPGIPLAEGRRHVLSRTIDEIIAVFGRMGFTVADGPEVEDEWHNFTALNIPAGHPARDPGDNFYMGEQSGVRRLLRTQTSTVQIRAMESQKPPLKVVAVGRVYRPDTHDATHYSMFHQIEGLCVDRDLSLVDLKTALLQFAHAYFGGDAEVRMRPSFFPFTEPSAEVDMKMHIRGQLQWVEIGGCGMVDPNVLTAVGLDPEVWRGYAFGLGIERIAMRRYGITDIRWLYENDARFLRQF
ncbi:MAG: phenylalanine--tRNA ligase subunit alpha [Phycisphaerales bacterium]|nr:phenylalanine--tRNA ligase subunit alpha [Phycisphaerales bacterium]